MKDKIIAAVAAVGVVYTIADNLPQAQAQETHDKYTMLAQVNHGSAWGYHVNESFSTRERCETARNHLETYKKRFYRDALWITSKCVAK